MRKKFVLHTYPNRFWNQAELMLYEDDTLKLRYRINNFYEVDKDWFYIFDTTGGSGIGFKKGKMIEKIYIGDGEFSSKEIRDTPTV